MEDFLFKSRKTYHLVFDQDNLTLRSKSHSSVGKHIHQSCLIARNIWRSVFSTLTFLFKLEILRKKFIIEISILCEKKSSMSWSFI
jgi:hypothetical protein